VLAGRGAVGIYASWERASLRRPRAPWPVAPRFWFGFLEIVGNWKRLAETVEEVDQLAAGGVMQPGSLLLGEWIRLRHGPELLARTLSRSQQERSDWFATVLVFQINQIGKGEE
jgi:hypothetical protein